MPRPLGWALTLLFVIAAWVLFRSPDFATASAILGSMAGLHGMASMKLGNAAAVAVAVALCLLAPPSQDLALTRLRPAPWLAVPAAAALVFLLLLAGGRVPNEFIYFQF